MFCKHCGALDIVPGYQRVDVYGPKICYCNTGIENLSNMRVVADIS